MGWRELLGWCEAMNRQRSPRELSPDSWAGYESSEWYQSERRKRDETRRG